ncbi:MAG TPA: GNAT family N-acetyltransferase [Gammaproteobacteria bacterium]|jgi:putative acetyltransferase|nr:GNAT family N-acetyltransferase [Gammaproteobacteria bacterium]
MKIDDLILQIRASSREMVRQLGLLNNCFSSIGSVSQCHALVELDAHGVMNLGQLSTVLNLEKSTTSRLVSQLCNKGICTIQPDENDRRNKLVSLTKKGESLVNKIHHEAKLQVKQALDILSDDEQHAVARGLSIYAKALKRSKLQNEYTIRKLLKADVPQLINLIKTVRTEFGFDASHPGAPLFEIELNKLYEIFNKKMSNYFILLQDKKVVGGVGFSPLSTADQAICELRGMYLISHLRGLGLGALLLQKVLEEAKKEGFKNCYLETQDFMYGANTLYKKFGFKQLDKPLRQSERIWTNSWYIKEV